MTNVIAGSVFTRLVVVVHTAMTGFLAEVELYKHFFLVISVNGEFSNALDSV